MTDSKPSDSNKKEGLHPALPHPVKHDDYPERPYSEARTKEQTEAMKDHGLL